jgi:outer membrane protein assembly factor BamB
MFSARVVTVGPVAEEEAKKPCVKCYVAFAATLVIVLAATGVWNPFPRVWDWVNSSEPLSTPDVVWQQRLGGTPKSVVIAGDAAVVEHRTTVEARGLATGVRLWEKEADWAAVAGDGAGSVVVTGKLLVKGYDVSDPITGTVRRHDKDAVAVWTFRNALLDVRCAAAQDCTLSAWDPLGSSPLWRVQLPGVGFVLFADNPEVLGTRPLTAKRVNADAAGPIPMPQLIGFPIDGRVHVVDTPAGRVVRELQPDREDRIVVAGGRVLRIVSTARDGSCYFTIEATDATTGELVWQQAGLNLRTADGAGCAQRRNPAGAENVILAVAADGREVVIDAHDGRLIWVGKTGQKVVALDSLHVLVRSADGKAIIGYELGLDRPLWSRKVSPDAQAAISPWAAVIMDREVDRIIVLDPTTGEELVVVRSSAEVAAIGPDGLIIFARREIGYIRYTGHEPAPPAPPPGPPGPPQPPQPPGGNGNGSSCTGPKKEDCPPGQSKAR